MRNHRVLAVLAMCSAVVVTACSDSGPSVSTEPDTSTTSSPTTTVPEPTTSTTGGPTTPTTAVPAGSQLVRYRGLQAVVPDDWPVYDLATDPHTCVRVDVHAVYLGTPGTAQDCPSRPRGHVGTVLISPVATASPIAVGRATQPISLNGMTVRIDPDPDAVGAFTVVLPDLGLVAFVTYGGSTETASAIVESFTPIPS